MTLTLAVGAGCLELGKAVEGPLRISLEALEVAPSGDQSVSVGGDRLNDELYVEGAPSGLLELARDEEGVVVARRNPA